MNFELFWDYWKKRTQTIRKVVATFIALFQSLRFSNFSTCFAPPFCTIFSRMATQCLIFFDVTTVCTIVTFFMSPISKWTFHIRVQQNFNLFRRIWHAKKENFMLNGIFVFLDFYFSVPRCEELIPIRTNEIWNVIRWGTLAFRQIAECRALGNVFGVFFGIFGSKKLARSP